MKSQLLSWRWYILPNCICLHFFRSKRIIVLFSQKSTFLHLRLLKKMKWKLIHHLFNIMPTLKAYSPRYARENMPWSSGGMISHQDKRTHLLWKLKEIICHTNNSILFCGHIYTSILGEREHTLWARENPLIMKAKRDATQFENLASFWKTNS